MSTLAEDDSVTEKEKNLPPAKRERLRQDRISLARRYESMKLYDEAIRYFKKAGETAEAERVEATRRKVYSDKAREFESAGDFQKAYDLMRIIGDSEGMDRIRRAHPIHDEGSEPRLDIKEPKVIGPQLWSKPNDPGDSADILAGGPASRTAPRTAPPKAESVPTAQAAPAPKSAGFRVCPYCGKALNLPKPPRFCPFCSEALQ